MPPHFEARVGVDGDDDFPSPRVRPGVVGAAQPVAFASVSAIEIAGAGVKGSFGRVVGHVVNVAGDDFVRRITEQRRIRRSPLLLEMRVLTEGIRELHGLAAVDRVVDVHGRRAADDVAVVSPHEHFLSIHLEAVLAIERMEIPAGQLGIHRRVREVIAAVRPLDGDGAVRLEVVRAQEKPRTRGKENVSVFQDDAPRDPVRIGKLRAVRPRFRVVLGKKDLPAPNPNALLSRCESM